MPTPEAFLRLAIDAALAGVAQGSGGPFGAVVVRRGVVVATGVNEVPTRNDPTAHAEIEAIRRACRVLKTFSLAGCEVYASCEPCPMCAGALAWARVDAVYFAATRADAARAGFDDARFHEAAAARPHVLRSVHLPVAGAERPFAAWLAKPDRIPY